jgi:hypothetical protein
LLRAVFGGFASIGVDNRGDNGARAITPVPLSPLMWIRHCIAVHKALHGYAIHIEGLLL